MGKSDFIGWALILGGLSVAGFFGYQGLKSMMGNGLFSSTTMFGGEEVKTDMFGNIPAGTQKEVISKKVASQSEANAVAAAGLAKVDLYTYDPTYERLYRDYTREMAEYTQAAKTYQENLTWVENPLGNIGGGGGAGSSSLYPWNWGKPSPQSQEAYATVQKEYNDAQVAYDELTAWMAKHS